jgi:CubicO group peptidase (beta-lactamase class C family)
MLAVFTAVLLIVLLLNVSQPFNVYTALEGHWAEKTLRQALEDGYIDGGQGLEPDIPVPALEAAAVLCRVLGPEAGAEAAGPDAQLAAARTLGLINPGDPPLDASAPLLRCQAYTMLAEAFQLVPAEPDMTVLADGTDGGSLDDKSRRALAALLTQGYIGNADVVHMDTPITRAEFLTVLYKIIREPGMAGTDTTNTAAVKNPVMPGHHAVLTKDTPLSGAAFGNLFFARSVSGVSLLDVTSDNLVIRSESLRAVELTSCRIQRLVFAQSAGETVLSHDRSTTVETVVIGTGSGSVTVEQEAGAVEVTGDHRLVRVGTDTPEVIVSGSHNSVVISPGAAVDVLRVLGTGTGNTVTVEGALSRLDIYSEDTAVGGGGCIGAVYLEASGCQIGTDCDKLVSRAPGADGLQLSMTAPDTVPAGTSLAADVQIAGETLGAEGRASWYLDDTLIGTTDLTLEKDAITHLEYRIPYSRTLAPEARLRFTLSAAGDSVFDDICLSRIIILENFPPAYYDRMEKPVPLIKAEAQAEVDRISEAYGAVGVQVAVIYNGHAVDAYTYGSATKGETDMADDTKIRVASISKVVMGMLAMSLADDQVIELDAGIGQYAGFDIHNPHFPEQPITVRSLLTHTSSLQIYGEDVALSGAAIGSNLRACACFTRLRPGSPEAWGYNNYGFTVLGYILEKATGETVNSAADRQLFAPLGIDAAFGGGGVDTSKLATLYYHDGSVARSVQSQMRNTGSSYPGQSGAFFCGGLTISAADLGKLVAVLANDGICDDRRILSTTAVSRMETLLPQKLPGASFYQAMPLRYRTGLYGQDVLYYHTGSAYGVYSLISYNPVTRNGVVVLTTGASGREDGSGIYAVCGEITGYIYAALDAGI